MIDLLKNRRSIRQFTDKKIEDEKLEALKKAILLAPSSRGFDPLEFIAVRCPSTLTKLSMLKPHGAAFLKGCDTAFVICGDTNVSDVCIEDGSIASITLQYAAESLGLKSCWAQVRLRPHNDEMNAEEFVKTTLGIPESFTVISVIGLGYPAEEKDARAEDSLKYQKIHEEKF